MSAARSSRSSPDVSADTTPLLMNSLSENNFRSRRFFRRRPRLSDATRFLRRASRGRMLREPSMRVRESAAEQIEERQSDWAYSRPIVILDLVWNFAFVVASIVVLVMSRNESPSMPLRLWIVGYVFQCVLHMAFVCVEYKRRFQQPSLSDSLRSGRSGGWWIRGNSNSSSESYEAESGDYVSETRPNEDETSVAKHLESVNTIFSFIWWIIGFYWVSAGGQSLTHDSSQLYWLCIAFLAFDVFFVVICVAVACVIGVAVCFCLPCIIGILYAVADREGATKDDIEQLPKYKFQRLGDFEKQNGEIQECFGGIMTKCDANTPIQHVLPREDAECCICLTAYDDGTELRELPCRHHFHCACIDKWLYINATCPLCKFNILKNGNQWSSEEV